MRTSILLAIAASSLTACSDQDIDSYSDQRPTMSVKQFYGAPIAGYGMFQDRSGRVTGRYYATLVPSWQGNEGTIVEKQWDEHGKLFLQQVWHISADADGKHFTGTATAIEGTMVGQTQGYAMQMAYTMRVPRENSTPISLEGDDWTYLQPDGSGLNRVALSKYGIHVGDITYDMRPLAKGEKIREGYFTR